MVNCSSHLLLALTHAAARRDLKSSGCGYRSVTVTQVARDAGLSRESLYRALSGEGNPEFGTILKVVKALGLKLHALPAHT